MIIPADMYLAKGGRVVPAWAAPMVDFPDADVFEVAGHCKEIIRRDGQWNGWKRMPAGTHGVGAHDGKTLALASPARSTEV